MHTAQVLSQLNNKQQLAYVFTHLLSVPLRLYTDDHNYTIHMIYV